MLRDRELFNFSHLNILWILYHHWLVPFPSNLYHCSSYVSVCFGLCPVPLAPLCPCHFPDPPLAPSQLPWQIHGSHSSVTLLQGLSLHELPCRRPGDTSLFIHGKHVHVCGCVCPQFISPASKGHGLQLSDVLFCSLDLPEWWQGPSGARTSLLTEQAGGDQGWLVPAPPSGLLRSSGPCDQWAREEVWGMGWRRLFKGQARTTQHSVEF